MTLVSKVNLFCYSCKQYHNWEDMHEERQYSFDTVNYRDTTKYCKKCKAKIDKRKHAVFARIHKWHDEFEKTGSKRAERNWKRAINDLEKIG